MHCDVQALSADVSCNAFQTPVLRLAGAAPSAAATTSAAAAAVAAAAGVVSCVASLILLHSIDPAVFVIDVPGMTRDVQCATCDASHSTHACLEGLAASPRKD